MQAARVRVERLGALADLDDGLLERALEDAALALGSYNPSPTSCVHRSTLSASAVRRLTHTRLQTLATPT